MTNKMRFYIGLLLLGLVMVGGGLWFLFRPSSTVTSGFEIAVTPATGNYLTNSQNISSDILLKEIRVERTFASKRFFSPGFSDRTVEVGEPILEVSGIIQNNHAQNKEIAMYAEGYDAAGKQVALTLDSAHITGQIGLHLEIGETGNFTLHLNYAESTKSIYVFANNYPVTPP